MDIAMDKTSFNVPSISCGVCSKKIEDGIMKLNGISNVNVDLKTKSVNVEYNSSQIQPSDIRKQVASLGYEVEQ